MLVRQEFRRRTQESPNSGEGCYFSVLGKVLRGDKDGAINVGWGVEVVMKRHAGNSGGIGNLCPVHIQRGMTRARKAGAAMVGRGSVIIGAARGGFAAVRFESSPVGFAA